MDSQPIRSDLITRRRMLQTMAGVAGAGVIGAMPASAAECRPCPTMTVWHLETDWAQPRGPHGKTRLVSRASRRAAQHRYALTEQDALDMNLHLCSYAPATQVEVCREAFMELWDELSYQWDSPWLARSVRIMDIRHVAGMSGGEALLGHALMETPETCDPGQAVGAVSGALPFTGFSGGGAAVAAMSMLAVGLVTLRMSRPGRHTARSAGRC